MAIVQLTLRNYPTAQVVTWLWINGRMVQDWWQDARGDFVAHRSAFAGSPEELHLRMIRFESRSRG